ncbi:cobyrinate a,c-diamide synthase [Oscillatoria salina]|uniref:cobyrinate a,c-diamide synthase n=1 Tax=Oscillatoria salina TaxID=331517 RepID=UPI001CCD4AAC|nr:cobyrinate a,c-diamide synthase [Oscillatoria salina]MBZ8181314.1 cobyrinate a,c-diamide synthase [Oscillatoria salina IIICB1]
MTLVIAGSCSGVGKTTVTLALLAFLSDRGFPVQAFKVGPDYIDPMFHTAITKRPCRNLDPVLTSEAYVQQCFARHSSDVDYALVEGVMGLFDGISWGEVGDFASTAHIARLLDLPVLLVLDCSKLSGSIAAIAHGFRTFDPRVKIAGVVLNQVGSDRHLQLLKNALEPLHLPILGVFYREQCIRIPDRHLGLVPAAEIPGMQRLFDQLNSLAEEHFDWERLLPLLKATPLTPTPPLLSGVGGKPKKDKIKIAVAGDRAFNFYYQDNLDILIALGAELIFWSPLADTKLPPGIQGLYFGGGFPEVFASELANNKNARHAVKKAIAAGITTYAECGGLMYLCEQIIDFDGQAWDMVGILPNKAVMSKKLTLGYRQATALENTFLFPAGTQITGHEFHRSRLKITTQKPLFKVTTYHPQTPAILEGFTQKNLHASYLHLHFGTHQQIPQQFLINCHNSTLIETQKN